MHRESRLAQPVTFPLLIWRICHTLEQLPGQ